MIAAAATLAAYAIVALGVANVLAYAVSGWRKNGVARALRLAELLAIVWLTVVFALVVFSDGNIVTLGANMMLYARSAIAVLLLLSLARLRMS